MRIRVNRFVSSFSWKHILGETGMIVFSILIALAANSWWQDREDRRTELEALREMRAALVLDLADLQSDLDAYRRVERSSRTLLDHLRAKEPYSAGLDSLFADLLVFRIHLSNSSPYESIRSRGLGLISNDSLRLGVIEYYGLQNATIALWNTVDTRLVDEGMRPYVRGRFVVGEWDASHRRTARPLDYAALVEDPYFHGLLMERIGNVAQIVPAYVTTIRDAESLMAMIDRQVARLD